jgi:hypothetical protein
MFKPRRSKTIDILEIKRNITFKDSSVVNDENSYRIKTDASEDDSTVSDVAYST